MGVKNIKYGLFNWGFSDLGEWAANPLLKQGEWVAGKINDKLGRGYNRNAARLDEAGKLYDENAKNNPYDKYYSPELRKYQTGALRRLYDIGNSDKLDPQAQAQLDAIRRAEDTQERGSREAIMMNANERGAGSSTGALLNTLTNNQASSDRRSAADTQVAGNQWQRALQSLYGASQMAGNLNTQDMNRARAHDLFSQYNISGKAGTLGAQGQNSINKAGQENAFWGGLLKSGIGAFSGGAGGAAAAGGGGEAANIGLSDYFGGSNPYQTYGTNDFFGGKNPYTR